MPFGVGKNTKLQSRSAADTGMSLVPARVLAVILDDTTYPDLFKKYGEWASIGGIVFEFQQTPTPNKSLADQQFALPLIPNLKNYPVTNEIVPVLVSADTDINTNTTSFKYYYLPPTNVWSSNHHNAIPDEIYTTEGLQPSQKKDYIQVGEGSVRRVSDGSTEIQFDNGFQERVNIKPLAPFAGDVIVEGRWGNSIRIGSTNSSGLPNTWSSIGQEGDPILILRNGQYEDNQPAWVNTSEDVNKDGASIYLTSTQKIDLTPARASYQSYPSPSEAPGEYTKNQIILNSGRIVLNSSSDHLLLASNKSINLNAVENIILDTPGETTIQASRVNIGSGNPVDLQPALKGDTTQELLDDILQALKALTTACASAVTPAGPVASLQRFATQYGTKIQALNTTTIKSDDTFIV